MMLMYCPVCKDMIKMIPEWRVCHCGMSEGLFNGDSWQVTGQAIPILVNCKSFNKAISQYMIDKLAGRKPTSDYHFSANILDS